MADSWDVNGPKVVYHLKTGTKWSNGDPVTAKDYEYAWKRALSPELASDYSYQLYGIKGGVEYNSCEKNCAALRDKVAVKATDDQTLEVTLTSTQPWFIQQSASVFLPAPRRPSTSSVSGGRGRRTSSRTACSRSRPLSRARRSRS